MDRTSARLLLPNHGTGKLREVEAVGSAEPIRTFAEEAPAPHPKGSIRPVDLAGSMRMRFGIPLHHKGCSGYSVPGRSPAFVPRRAPLGHPRSSKLLPMKRKRR